MRRKAEIAAPKREIPAESYGINAKSAEYILCPANAIADAFYKRNPDNPYRLKTVDGAEHIATFVCTWCNRDCTYDEELEATCQKYYGMTFEGIRSMWIGRLGRVDDYWHLIKLS